MSSPCLLLAAIWSGLSQEKLGWPQGHSSLGPARPTFSGSPETWQWPQPSSGQGCLTPPSAPFHHHCPDYLNPRNLGLALAPLCVSGDGVICKTFMKPQSESTGPQGTAENTACKEQALATGGHEVSRVPPRDQEQEAARPRTGQNWRPGNQATGPGSFLH